MYEEVSVVIEMKSSTQWMMIKDANVLMYEGDCLIDQYSIDDLFDKEKKELING